MLNPVKTILKLLLLITMVVEPVLLSYAMAGMGHQHSGVSMTNGANVDQVVDHTAMSHHAMQLMGDNMPENLQADESGGMENCCSTPACAAAVLASFSMYQAERHSSFYSVFHVSWKVIILPSETKPPRRLIG